MEKNEISGIVEKYTKLATSEKSEDIARMYRDFADYIEKNSKAFTASCYEAEEDLWDYYKGMNNIS